MNIHGANSAPHLAGHQPAPPPASLEVAAPIGSAAQPKDEVLLSDAGVKLAQDAAQAPAHGIESRVAAFADRTQGRLELLSGSGTFAGGDLGAISKQFAENVARVQAGLESGGLDASDAARGLQNALTLVREGVRATFGPDTSEPPAAPAFSGAPPALETAPAASAPGLQVEPEVAPPGLDVAPGDPHDNRERLAGLGSQIADRLASLNLSGFPAGKDGALASLTGNFESVLGRLDHALDKGAIGGERLSSIVASAIDDLSAGLMSLLKSNDGLSTYGPTSKLDVAG